MYGDTNDQVGISEKLSVVGASLDNVRRLIEANKERRWEAFKWTMGINLALIGAAIATPRLPANIIIPALIGSMLGAALISYYHARVDSYRKDREKLTEWLEHHVFDVSRVLGKSEGKYDRRQDWWELAIFVSIIFGSLAVLCSLLHLFP
jgi:hypothetical protein